MPIKEKPKPLASMRIGVIIVNYNGGEVLRRSIESLKNQTHPADRCLVIDNQSLQEPLRGDESWLNGIEVIKSETNLGFAAANNLGASLFKDMDWLAFLNPDAFAEPTWLQRLCEEASNDPQTLVFASRQINAQHPNLLDGAGDSLTRGGRPYRRGFGEDSSKAFLKADQVFSACGASMFIHRSIFEAVGGFDEDFFCYLEDIDLGFRLQLEGYACRYLPDAKVHHLGSAITGKQSDFSTYHGHRNLVWLYLKNMPAPLFWLYLPQHLALTLAAFFMCIRRGQGRVFLRAKWDAMKDLKKFLMKRSLIQRRRKASTLTIWKALSPERLP